MNVHFLGINFEGSTSQLSHGDEDLFLSGSRGQGGLFALVSNTGWRQACPSRQKGQTFLKFLCPFVPFVVVGEWLGLHSHLVVGGVCKKLVMQSRLFEDGISIVFGKCDLFWVNIRPEASFDPVMEGNHLLLNEWFDGDVVLMSLF